MHLGADDRAERQSATWSRNGRPPFFASQVSSEYVNGNCVAVTYSPLTYSPFTILAIATPPQRAGYNTAWPRVFWLSAPIKATELKICSPHWMNFVSNLEFALSGLVRLSKRLLSAGQRDRAAISTLQRRSKRGSRRAS